MKNWKTTVGGIFAAAGTALSIVPNVTIKIVGGVLAAFGMALLGGFAKDNNVTGGTVCQDPPKDVYQGK